MRQGKSRSPGLISNIDVSALAAVMFVVIFAFIFLTATPHHGVSADLPKVIRCMCFGIRDRTIGSSAEATA